MYYVVDKPKMYNNVDEKFVHTWYLLDLMHEEKVFHLIRNSGTLDQEPAFLARLTERIIWKINSNKDWKWLG